MSGSAQRERRLWPEEDADTSLPASPQPASPQPDLKQLAAERLAAHRRRRGVIEARQPQQDQTVSEQPQFGSAQRALTPDASRIRDAVAAQYRQRVSYREYLAAQAERAMEQARAEVEVAERKARAVAEAQVQLLAEIEQWEQESPAPLPELLPSPLSPPPAAAEVRRTELPAQPPPAPEQQVYAEEQDELDREIAFRLAPQFDEHLLEALPIQANVLEFPRQLVAARKARPRLAEGPLRDLADAEPDTAAPPQLRIFEVEPEDISAESASADSAFAQANPPEWQRMVLDAAVVFPDSIPGSSVEPAPDTPLRSFSAPDPWIPSSPVPSESNLPEPGLLAPIYPCGVDRRLMAALVDATCIAAAAIGFACAAVMVSGRTLNGISRGGLAAAAFALLAAFFALHQFLFLALGDQTPGMMYARIGICTFSDENPTRQERCRRAWATLLAALPLGLGLLKMAIDIDHLGWHDRRTRTYLREY
jgi:hypothetical protein